MSHISSPPPAWDIQAARALYNIHRWGAKYFDINDAGHVVAMPLRESGAVVDLTDVIEEAKGRGLKFPVLIRFQDILRDRVEAINQAFAASIAEVNYQNKYRGVFPIKVNQLREVVEEILDAGKPYQFGLEVGSKPELFAALALQNQPGCLIVCNGYKDAIFIRMAMMGIKLGKKVVMVVEKLEELRQIISVSRQTGVEPQVGIRVRLISKGAGKWADSGGENAKFGLNTAELLAAAEIFRAENMGHCLKLLHFHIGSQVPDILTIKKAVQEAARFYAKLYKMGFAIESMNVGGGLGVDYDGSRSAFDSSTNYTLQEYTNDIVFFIAEVCNQEQVPHPQIISESGRAIVAHHSVLLVETFGTIEKISSAAPMQYGDKEHALVLDLLDIRKNLPKLNRLEAVHDASDRREEAQHMFALGLLDLLDKAKIETLYWEIARDVVQSFRGQSFVPEEISRLQDSLGEQFLCNFSVFQSLLDHWALGQLFPIMPVGRLNEKPTCEATLVDITCDSDGEVRKFIDLSDPRDTLPLHAPRSNGNGPEPYYLGFFLMGAYQDIMGDLHNLFGRVNELHVFLDPDEAAGYYVEEIIEGSTIVQTLTSVQYDENEMKRQMKMQIDEAIKSDRLKPSEGMRLLDDYERGLKEYTYLTIESPMDAAKADLMRDLGRLARGLSALFWGLPLTLVANVETAQTDRLDFLGGAAFVPAMILNGVLWYGLRQLRGFQKQERIWQQAIYRAEIFSVVNVGLSPFLFWWHRFPAVSFYVACVECLAASGLLFLVFLNQVLRRLSAMLPDEMLRSETRTFTTCSVWMLLAVLVGLCLYITFGPVRMPDIIWGNFHLRPQERGLWLALFLTLMPVATTMALLWKIKEAIFTGLFTAEH